jgi:hypothetical protein
MSEKNIGLPENRQLVVIDSTEPVINSDSLFYYLLSVPYLWEKGQQFSNHLDLRPYSIYLKELYDQVKVDFVLPESEREQRSASQQDFHTTDPETNDFLQESKARIEGIRNRQAAVERSRTIYSDRDDLATIKATEIVHGTYSQVQAGLYDVIDNGGIPLLDVHTHPSDSPFSIHDYAPIITEYFVDGPAAVNGLIVICPNIQILALATALTPMLLPEATEQLMQNSAQEFEDRKNTIYDPLLQRFLRTQEGFIKIPFNRLQNFLRTASVMEEEMKTQGFTDDEIKRKLTDYAEEHRRITAQATTYLEEVLSRRQRECFDTIAYQGNYRAIDFARSQRVELYSSTNFRDFYRFSA